VFKSRHPQPSGLLGPPHCPFAPLRTAQYQMPLGGLLLNFLNPSPSFPIPLFPTLAQTLICFVQCLPNFESILLMVTNRSSYNWIKLTVTARWVGGDSYGFA
jgi:hypothetical protein